MDKQLKEDIRKHYWKEYSDAAAATQPGLLGKFMRWGDRLQKKYADDLDINFHSVAALALGVAAGFATAAFTGGVAPLLVGVGGFMGYMATTITGYAKISNRARKNVETDISNGSLLQRYKNVLGKKLAHLQSQDAELTTALDTIAKAGPAFNAVAAKPVKRPLAQRLSLHRNKNVPKV